MDEQVYSMSAINANEIESAPKSTRHSSRRDYVLSDGAAGEWNYSALRRCRSDRPMLREFCARSFLNLL